MIQDDDPHDTAEITRRPFFLMTGVCEDGAALAAEGQARDLVSARIYEISDRLYSIWRSLMIIADAARTLAERQR